MHSFHLNQHQSIAFRWLRTGAVPLITLVLMMINLQPAVYAAGVVGAGTPASCTAAALMDKLSGGGTVTFNCGPAPVTIAIATTLDITAPDTTIDGGGKVTLQGVNTRIIRHRSLSSASVLTLKNLTLRAGRSSGAARDASGAGVQSLFQGADPSFKPTLNIINVTCVDNAATISSFDNGNSGDFGGGAIYSQGGALNVVGSTFTDNDANNGSGGAIHVLQSTLSIEGSQFSANSAIGNVAANSLGGAIYVDGTGGGDFSLKDSTFIGNTTYNTGGAIYINMYENSSTFTVDHALFQDNAVVGGTRAQGGAIGGGSTNHGPDTGESSIVITHSAFVGNSVKRSAAPYDGSGGAIAFPQRAITRIINSTFTANRAYGSSYNANGGAIYIVNNTTPFQIVNSTIAGNSAGWVGGGISNSAINDQPGGVLHNTIIANNTADNGPNDWNILQQCSAELADGGGNFQWPPRNANPNYWNEATCLEGKSGIAQRTLPDFRDPQLEVLQQHGGATPTMALPPTSPAIDAANPATCPATDQRDVVRPQGAACDSGAYELLAELRLSPAFVAAGSGDFQLVVSGFGFTPTSTVLWNGAARPTTFVDSTTLRASISSSDVANVGSAQIRVSDSSFPAQILRIVARVHRVHLPLIGGGG